MSFRSTSLIIKGKKFLLAIFFIAVCEKSVAQSNNSIDSLLNILKNATEDTNKVNALNRLSRLFWQTPPNAELKNYADKALVLAEKLNFKKGMAFAYHSIALSYDQAGNYSESLKNYITSLKNYEEIGERRVMAELYHAIANIYGHQGKYSEALKKYVEALNIFKELGDKISVGYSYQMIGRNYWMQGNYVESGKNSFAAMRIFEELGDKPSRAECYRNIAGFYQDEGNYSEALKNHLLDLKLREEIGNKAQLAATYNNLAYFHRKAGNYSEALKYGLLALKFNQEVDDTWGITVTYENLGEIYFYEGNYSDALKNYFACLQLAEKIGDQRYITYCNNNIGRTYIYLGRYREAKEYLVKALSLSKGTNAKEEIKRAYQGLSKLDSAVGNYKEAFVHYKLYIDYKDSLLNEASRKQMVVIREQYESEKKDKEIELLNKENDIQQLQLKKQKQAKYYFIAGLTLFSVLAFFVYRTYRTRQKVKLLTLRNKIASDLHDDVGSTLSSISIFSQMAQQQSKEVIPMLETIGESSRKMLDAMADIVWTIDPHNDQFEKIILRMKNFAYELLGAKNIDFEFVADEEISKVNLTMEVKKNLYLIFKEATNNMVKYADANKAMFAIKSEKNNLSMTIRDNGKGFDMNTSIVGNGLKNMKRRANEMGANLLIDSYPGRGTTIRLNIAV